MIIPIEFFQINYFYGISTDPSSVINILIIGFLVTVLYLKGVKFLVNIKLIIKMLLFINRCLFKDVQVTTY